MATAEASQERPRTMFQLSNVQSYSPDFSPGQSPRMGNFLILILHRIDHLWKMQNQSEVVVVSSMSESIKPPVAVPSGATAAVINIHQLVLIDSKSFSTCEAV